jgi:cytochrome c oxidase cbb3-type subunit 4
VDINVVREIVTVVCFVAFLGIVFWAYSARNKQSFDAAARLPLDDDTYESSSQSQNANLSGAGK